MLVLNDIKAVLDLITGATFLGTGGGGQPEDGIKSLISEINSHKIIELLGVEDIPDNAWTACPFLMGSIAPTTEEKKKEMDWFGLGAPKYAQKEMMAEAIKELEHYTGIKIDIIIPIELGGANTAAAIAAASLLGKKSVNGDYTGRAIPEIPQTTPYLNGKKLWPISSVDSYGNICIIVDALNYLIAERIGKYLSAATFGLAAQCGFLMKGEEAKKIIVRNTISECIQIGQIIREAKERGEDVPQKLSETLNCWVLFKGEVISRETEDRDGYYWGVNTLRGINEFQSHEFKIWFKNENHITWFNGKTYVTSPDIIAIIDIDNCEPVTNTKVRVGQKIAVLGLKARGQFCSDKGLEILGPKHFGFDFNYVPIENLVK